MKYIYERIVEDIRRQIEEGELRPGERLPSVRETAVRYECSKLTAVRAFDALKEADLIENVVGSGSYVAYPDPEEEGRADFSASILSEEFFPYEEAGTLLAESLRAERGRVFSAAPVKGDPALARRIAAFWSVGSSSLWTGSGGQQTLDLTARLFKGTGSTLAPGMGRDSGKAEVLVEDPSYPAALALFKPTGAVPIGQNGIDPGEFARFWEHCEGGGPRVFYTMPDLHNPTGFRYSREIKIETARLAEKLGVWIIEDDHLSELSPDRGSVPRFVDLIPDRTIWIKSLSKILAPGIRICAVHVPPALEGRWSVLRSESDPGPSLWLQLFTERFLGSEAFPEHLERVARIARARRESLHEALSSIEGVSMAGADAGYSVWLRMAGGKRGGESPGSRSLNRRIEWTEGARFGSSALTRECLRISFMGIPESGWKQAVARLTSALRSEADRRRGG